MIGACRDAPLAVRVWIVEYDDWQPSTWRDVPPRARVLGPLEDGAFSAHEGEAMAAGFNEQMLTSAERRWAVIQPVTLRFEGDLVAGEALAVSERPA
jgi:hypothetical protein